MAPRRQGDVPLRWNHGVSASWSFWRTHNPEQGPGGAPAELRPETWRNFDGGGFFYSEKGSPVSALSPHSFNFYGWEPEKKGNQSKTYRFMITPNGNNG